MRTLIAILMFAVAATAGAASKQEIDAEVKQTLAESRKSEGWKAGVDGSVALATLGAGGAIDTETAKQPIIGFIFSNKGLMYKLSFEGSKITRVGK